MRCPVCRAENNLETACRRCKADLSLLVQMERERQRTVERARQLLRSGQVREGLAQAQQAHHFRPDADSWRLLTLAHLLLRQFPDVIHCHEALTALSSTGSAAQDRA